MNMSNALRRGLYLGLTAALFLSPMVPALSAAPTAPTQLEGDVITYTLYFSAPPLIDLGSHTLA